MENDEDLTTSEIFSSFLALRKTKHKLPIHVDEFLQNLQKNFQVTFFYFGSIQRDDYIANFSDLDVDIFPKDKSPKSFAIELANYLDIPLLKIKKIEWTLPLTKEKIIGYKLKTKFHDVFHIEFSIYPFVYKPYVLYHQAQKLIMPFWVTWCLILIKYLFYKYKMISSDLFYSTKRIIMSYGIGISPDEFKITKYATVHEFLNDVNK